MLSLRHIESQTMVALDKTFGPKPKLKKRVGFKIDDVKAAMLKPTIQVQNAERKTNKSQEEDDDTTSDQEENVGNQEWLVKIRDRKRKIRKFSRRDLELPNVDTEADAE